jgi:hypothetical protein
MLKQLPSGDRWGSGWNFEISQAQFKDFLQRWMIGHGNQTYLIRR